MSSVPHECPPGRRCFDCNPRAGVEHTGDLPAWMERPIGSERPTPVPVPYAPRPSYERAEMLRAETRRVVDEAIRTAPASARDTGRTSAARVALGVVDEAMERLAYVLMHLHDAATIEELDETQRGPSP